MFAAVTFSSRRSIALPLQIPILPTSPNLARFSCGVGLVLAGAKLDYSHPGRRPILTDSSKVALIRLLKVCWPCHRLRPLSDA